MMKQYILSGSYPKWQTHTVEISLQYDSFKGTISYKLSGNCLGGSILQSAISEIEDGDYDPIDDSSRKHCLLDDDGYLVGLCLYDENGEELIIEDTHDLMNCVVGVRIVDVEPDNA